MYQTPWTNKGSSVPSDRIRPTPSQPPAAHSSKGKAKQLQPQDPPKSKELRRLESLLKALRSSSGIDKDPKGGCFCQARQHSLSSYTPICHACGLVLCSANLPQYACPHCASPTLKDGTRSVLLAELEIQIAGTIAKELEERERAREEARKAAGAFPALGSASGPLTIPALASMPPPPNQSHKVLSLNSKTKKVIVSSYTTTPASSRPASRADTEEEPIRVPPPLTEVSFVKRHPDPARPWENLRGAGARYIPPARVEIDNDSKGSGRKGKGGKGKNRGSNVEGGAGQGSREA